MSMKFKSAGSAALAFSLTFGVVGLLAEAPAAASAGTRGASDRMEVSRTVSAADLDLSKSSDVRRLHARVRSATREMCSDHGRRGISTDVLRCTTAARDSAQPQVASLLDRSQRLAAAGQSITIRTSTAVAGDE